MRVPLDYAPARGPRVAPVTVVVFSDFECPHCRRAVPILEELQERYPGEVRVVFRQFPLAMHPNALTAAAASLEAYAQGGEELFWRFHDRIFAMESLDRERVLHVAEQIGVDREQLNIALAEGTHTGAIAADIALGQAIGVSGTPSFFINGRPIEGALPVAELAAIVDEELQLAEALRARGVEDRDLYTVLTWNGRAFPDMEAPAEPEGEIARRAPTEDDAAVPIYRVPIIGRPPTWGPDDALVTIVMFSDFQCPFCSRVEPTLNELRRRYAGDLRIVWMNNPLPFHTNAGPAAQAALEAYRQRGDEAFWQFHDVLFENQRALTRADLEGYAQAAGLDLADFRAALDDDRHLPTIRAEQELTTSLGARGTPAFFINGRKLMGAQPLQRFVDVIELSLAEARRMVSAGVDPGDLYAAVIEDGLTQAGPEPTRPNAPRPAEDPDREYELPIPRSAPRRGARRPQVVIQEMADLQCPFCGRVQATLDRLMEEYGDRVQLVWRDYPLPFHQEAGLAAEAAREVKRQKGDRAFFQYLDLVFQNQRELGLEKLIEYAGQIRGVNTRRLRRALERRTHREAVEADMAAVREVMGSIGTPTFLIGGRKLVGAQPYDAFRDAVDAALQRAGNNP